MTESKVSNMVAAGTAVGEDLSALLQPMKVGPITVANRMMMAGMSAGNKIDENGAIHPQMAAYLLERARGGPGLIAIGATRVAPVSVRNSHSLELFNDDVIPSLGKLAESVHQYGTKLGIQLWNGGGTEGTSPDTLMSPSGLSSNVRTAMGDATSRRLGSPNQAMTVEQIEEMIGYFAAAARRCAEAGLDFVEIHAGHGYLLSNFLTPLFNRREDEYGGSFENRTQMLLRVIRAVRKAVGDDIAVGLKYNGSDFLGDQGWTIEDSCRFAPLAEEAGVDYITITAGLVGTPQLTIPPMYEPQGCYSDLAAAVRPFATVPIGTIGRIKNPLMARDLIAEGKADFVCFGRSTIADPDFFGKVRRGALQEIRPCLADCRGCIDEHLHRHPGGGDACCVVNPRMGRELDCVDVEGASSGQPKTVVVVGGGLAGMEAARMTAFSGHHVTLFERRVRLGGQMLLAREMPGRREIGDILFWYERQLDSLGVVVHLSTEVDAAMITDLRPDVIVVATGSQPSVPQNMIDLVMNSETIDMILLDNLVESDMPVGKSVLVVGGDQNGMVIADYLAERGARVTVSEFGRHFGRKLAAHDRWYLLNRQNAKHVKRIKNVHDVMLSDESGIILQTADGPVTLGQIDSVVFASERKSDRAILEAAEKSGATVIVAGDAHDVVSENAGTIFANIAHAYNSTRRI